MVAVAVAGAAVSVWLLTVVVLHASRPVYDLPPSAVAIGVLGSLASLAGWVKIARTGDGVLLGGAVFVLLLVGGIAALMSIGIVFLLLGAIVGARVGRAAGLRTAAGEPFDVPRAVGTASLVGVGFIASSFVAATSPVVECQERGVTTSSSIFRSGSGGGSGMAGPDGEQVGTLTQGDRIYRYRCAGTELVEFEARDA